MCPDGAQNATFVCSNLFIAGQEAAKSQIRWRSLAFCARSCPSAFRNSCEKNIEAIFIQKHAKAVTVRYDGYFSQIFKIEFMAGQEAAKSQIRWWSLAFCARSCPSALRNSCEKNIGAIFIQN